MDTYALIIVAVLLLGVIGLIALLEHRLRTHLAQFKQLQQAVTEGLKALEQLRVTVETGAKENTKAVERLTASLEESIKF